MSVCGGLRAQAILGLVRDTQGRPVAGARVSYCPRSIDDALWRASTEGRLPPHRGAFTAKPILGRSDARGAYRIQVPADQRSGGLLIEHPEQGAAWLHDVTPDSPRIVQLVTTGRIALATGDRFDAKILALPPTGGRPARLPNQSGDALLLPPGRYRLLITVGNRSAERECRVRAGMDARLVDPPSADSLPSFKLSASMGNFALPDWPDHRLARTPGTRLTLPALRGQGRFIERFDGAAGTALFEHRYDGRATTVELDRQASPRWRDIQLWDAEADAPLREATVSIVVVSGRGTTLLSKWRSDAEGRARVATPATERVTGRAHLIVHRPGCAPRCKPLLSIGTAERVLIRSLAPSATLRLRVASNDPVLDAPTEVRIEQAPASILQRSATTNRRGEVVFEDLTPGTATLSVEQPEHLPGSHRVELRPGTQQIVLELQPGLELSGRVTCRGVAVAGAVVELRALGEGQGQPKPRLCASDTNGSFSFRGLQDRRYIVRALRELDGVTWSAQWSRAAAGGDTLTLDLRSEDPPLPGTPVPGSPAPRSRPSPSGR